MRVGWQMIYCLKDTIGAFLSISTSMLRWKQEPHNNSVVRGVMLFSSVLLLETLLLQSQHISHSHPISYPDSHNQSRDHPRRYQELNEGSPSLL